MTAKKPVKDIVKRPDWQAVRKRLLGQWKERPHWACSQLKRWLGPTSQASNDKLRIVMNYLTGTGFRTGRIKPQCVIRLRTQISVEIKKRKAKKRW
jgi:hypothetical protein